MRDLKPGDVVHVTRYGTEKCDMWVVIISDRRRSNDDTMYSAYTATDFFARDRPRNIDPTSRSRSIDDTDRLEVPSELPDDVSVALAKWSLMGESHELDD